MMPPRHASLSSSGGHDCQAYPAGKLGETDRLFLICLSSRNLAQETLFQPRANTARRTGSGMLHRIQPSR